MNNKHKKKFIIYMQIGFIFITIGIAAILYFAYTDGHKLDWILWATISVLAFNAGLLCLGNAIIHKVKSDLIRRQKQKTKTDNEAEEQGK